MSNSMSGIAGIDVRRLQRRMIYARLPRVPFAIAHCTLGFNVSRRWRPELVENRFRRW